MDVTKEPHVLLPGSSLPPVTGATPAPGLVKDKVIEVSVWIRRQKSAPPLPDLDETGEMPLAKRAPAIDRAEFTRKWGADQADVDEVLTYVKPFGITPVEGKGDLPNTLARRLVALVGKLADFERAFGVTIALYVLPGFRPFIVRTGAVRIPDKLKGIVLGVFGLDERPIGVDVLPSAAPASISTPLPTPPQIGELYGFPRVRSTKGQCIALMHFGGGYLQTDIDDYFQNVVKLKPPHVIAVPVAGGANSPGSDYDKEVTLDIQVAGSIAEEVTLANYFAPHTERGWIEAIATAVHDATRNPNIMSISWGAAELGSSNSLTWTRNGMAAMRDRFRDAAHLGMTVFAAAGNHGSQCRVEDRRAHVVYPAADPRVIGCSGTEIADFARAPDKEPAWKRGGGGISDVSAVPAYQPAADLPASLNDLGKRLGAPDVAGYAAPGYEFIVGGSRTTLPGTSLVAPLYAGLIARLNVINGTPLGYILPIMYKFHGLFFRDIDDPVSNGTSNSYQGTAGYYGHDGWDARTGLGVFKAGVFAKHLKQ